MMNQALGKFAVTRDRLQLLACACLSLAQKAEEIARPRPLEDFVMMLKDKNNKATWQKDQVRSRSFVFCLSLSFSSIFFR